MLSLGSANLTLAGCNITGNTASSGNGGGLANYGTASLSDGTISGNATTSGSGIGIFSQGTGTTTLTNCTVVGNKVTAGGAVEVSGGTLVVAGSQITGSTTAIQVINNATGKIIGGAMTGDGWGVLVGATATDTCTLEVQNADLSNDKIGVQNAEKSVTVDATLDWWGSPAGPLGTGASTAVGNVNFSPWLGDSKSVDMSTPHSLGFSSAAGDSFVVDPSTAGPGASLTITLGASSWSVAPASSATISFTGSGGSVTIHGEQGRDVFMITNSAVAFAANDAFKGAAIEFDGEIARTIDAIGITNTFDVSGWTGAGTLTAPQGEGTVIATSLPGTRSKTPAGYTLTDTSLISSDGLALTLSGISTANLSATAAKGNPVIVDASAFSGTTNLTAGGTGKAILFGGQNGGTLIANGSGNDVLIGGSGPNILADGGTGSNILIGGGGSNSISGNGKDILISGTTSYDSNTAARIAAPERNPARVVWTVLVRPAGQQPQSRDQGGFEDVLCSRPRCSPTG